MLCYAMLCYAMLCYAMLYYTILYYTILYYTILYYTALHCTALHCTVLNYTILYYTISLTHSLLDGLTNWLTHCLPDSLTGRLTDYQLTNEPTGALLLYRVHLLYIYLLCASHRVSILNNAANFGFNCHSSSNTGIKKSRAIGHGAVSNLVAQGCRTTDLAAVTLKAKCWNN